MSNHLFFDPYSFKIICKLFTPVSTDAATTGKLTSEADKVKDKDKEMDKDKEIEIKIVQT